MHNPGDVVTIAKHAFTIQYTVTGDAPAPEEEDTFARSLMEKAGLEVERRHSKVPEATRASARVLNKAAGVRLKMILLWTG